MKKMMQAFIICMIAAFTIFLYQKQLGAVPFLLLSYYCFYNAYRQKKGSKKRILQRDYKLEKHRESIRLN